MPCSKTFFRIIRICAVSLYSFIKTPVSDLDDLIGAYRQSLSAPLDGMWEHFTHTADHYAIKLGAKIWGYCAVNAEHNLLQFSVDTAADARQIFSDLLTELNVTGATLASFETHALALCMDQQKSVSVNACLYQMPPERCVDPASFAAGDSFKLVGADDIAAAIAFAVETLGMNEGWLNGYFGDLVQKEQLNALWRGGKIIATGECRVSESQRPFADVGMVVGSECRGQGIATNVLRALGRLCEDRGLKAICSTDRDNIPAQKAIAKAGFVCHHRMLAFGFSG